MTLSVPNFRNAKILVVGDIMLDRYWQGRAERISPEAPVPVVNVKEIKELPGGAANVAFNLTTLGCQVGLLGVVGDDEAGTCLENILNESGVSTYLVKDGNLPTITKLRVVSQQQQLVRLDFENNLKYAIDDAFHQQYTQLLNDYDVVVLSDYAKGTLVNVQSLIQVAREQKKNIIVDPKGSDFTKYMGASIITPNNAEFVGVAGSYDSDADLAEKAKSLMTSLNLDSILVTRGEHGMSLFCQAGEQSHVPTQAKEVYDVTGAGDTVISVFAAAQACNLSKVEAAELANVAAGVVVGKLGTATISASELRMAVKENRDHVSGVVTEQQLISAVQDAHERGEKIVMTNGCFDILHAGHVSYLEQARHLGDRLIVAVNDDDSVKRLKGHARPIIPIEQRMAVLAGLSSVDWVVSFSEDTPERLICHVLPDLLVKGGDYKPEDIAGYECILSNGGHVEVLCFVDSCSTSKIVSKILSENFDV